MRLYCTQRCPYLGAQVAGVPFLEVPFLGVSLLGSGHQARLGTVNTRHYAASQLPAGNSGRLRNVRLSLHPWVSAAERSDTTAVDPAALASHKPVQLSMYRPRTRRAIAVAVGSVACVSAVGLATGHLPPTATCANCKKQRNLTIADALNFMKANSKGLVNGFVNLNGETKMIPIRCSESSCTGAMHVGTTGIRNRRLDNQVAMASEVSGSIIKSKLGLGFGQSESRSATLSNAAKAIAALASAPGLRDDPVTLKQLRSKRIFRSAGTRSITRVQS